MPEDVISVLLPVHAGIDPQHLARALQSLVDQTRPADELVLVEDGPLTDSLRDVIAGFDAGPMTINRVVLQVNSGAGVANGKGLLAATGDIIAKMDADDIALPRRFERQERIIAEEGADVCGSAMLEFDGDESNVVGVRKSPETHQAIARRMRINSAVNHPASMYRRSAALEVGGYSDLRYMQDYDLFARMLMNGARFKNLAEPLTAFRTGEALYRRRTSTAMNSCEWRLQRNLRTCGLIGRTTFLRNLVVRFAFRRLPHPVLKWAYKRYLHS